MTITTTTTTIIIIIITLLIFTKNQVFLPVLTSALYTLFILKTSNTKQSRYYLTNIY